MKAQLVKTPRYAGGGITALMPKIQASRAGAKALARSDAKAKKTTGVPRFADTGNVSTQYVSNVPPGGEQAYANLIGRAEDFAGDLSSRPPAYEGDRLAQFTDLQKQGFNSISGLGMNGRTGEAGDLAQFATRQAINTGYTPNTSFTPGAGPQQVGSQNFTQPGTAQEYMNPYMQNVVDIQKREATRADDIARTARNASAVNAGAFGGSRQAIVEAEAGRNLAQQQNDIQAQGANAAFQQAQQQFNADQTRGLQGQMANQNAGLQYGNQGLEAQRLGEASRQYGSTLGLQGLQTGIQGATAAGGIGNTLYNQGLTSAKTQVDAGGLQQQNVQQGLDQAYKQHQEDINFPYQQMGFMSDILRGSQGSTRSMYGTEPGPSGLQTLAGLASLTGGMTQKNSIFGARGGEVKSDAIGRGLARIAPDSVGNFASGGIVGFAEAGAVPSTDWAANWKGFEQPSPDVIRKRERDAREAEAELQREQRGRPYRDAEAAGMRGPYIAGTGLYTGLIAPPGEPDSAAAPAPAAAPKGPDFNIAGKKETPPVVAGPDAEKIGFNKITLPTGGGGGGGATSLAELKRGQLEAGVDWDTLKKEGIAGLERQGAIAKKSAEEDVAGLTALHDKMGQASLKREERLKEQGSTLAGDSLIRTGMAILTADPKRGWLAATAAGATVGFAEYTARKEKLDASLDTLLEAREQAEFARGKDMLGAKRAVRAAEHDLEVKKTEFGNALGLKKNEAAGALFNTWQHGVEGARTRANATGNALLNAQTNVAIHNAQGELEADKANAQLEMNRIRYGVGAGGKKVMTQDQYNDNVRAEADALMKATVDENGVPYTRARATAEAQRIVDARRANTPAVPSTAGWSKN